MRRAIVPEIYEPSYYPYGLSEWSIPESPEAVIARSKPLSALKLLDRMSVRSHYENITAIGGSIANIYINRAGGHTLDRIDSVDIIPHRTWFTSNAIGLTIKFNKRRK